MVSRSRGRDEDGDGGAEQSVLGGRAGGRLGVRSGERPLLAASARL